MLVRLIPNIPFHNDTTDMYIYGEYEIYNIKYYNGYMRDMR